MEKCCEGVLSRSLVGKCCWEVLEKCCEGALWRSLVEKCCRGLLEKNVVEKF